MLSYQHIYHAGARADVHKHLALVMLIRRLQHKPTSMCFVDAHAGRGIYDLRSAEATTTNEARDGIVHLAGAAEPPDPVRDYLNIVAGFNPGGGLRYYPGSCAIAQSLLREGDRAVLLELHPQEAAALKDMVAGDRRVSVHARDCYEGLPALLPPPIRRGIVLIDPSYEVKSEYGAVVELLSKVLRRWSTAVCVLWYPILREARHRHLLRSAAALALPSVTVCELRFRAAQGGLAGSGLIVVNTPWQFADEFSAAMRYVAGALDGASHSTDPLEQDPRPRHGMDIT
jgi:23S rRNA (adenine2030-N6)-methyltransferase